LPFDVGHQLVMGGICALGFFGVLASGLPTSIPWPYGFMAFLSVLTTTALGARSVSRFRRVAFVRETTLRQAHDHLRTALGRARAIADGKPIVVRVDCELPRISTDGMRLRQILNNLATNAAKFTDVGTITIRAFRDRDAAVFEVRDTGRGIPAAQHEAIFAA